MITNGTEKQVAFALKIRAALIQRIAATGMIAAGKAIEDFVAGLDANTSADAKVWIDAAYEMTVSGTIIGDNGELAIDPRAFLRAVTAQSK